MESIFIQKLMLKKYNMFFNHNILYIILSNFTKRINILQQNIKMC